MTKYLCGKRKTPQMTISILICPADSKTENHVDKLNDSVSQKQVVAKPTLRLLKLI